MIKIYWMQSPYVYKVRAALEQKWLTYEHVSVNLMEKSKKFLDVAPIGKIPVMEDSDGTIIWDSLNIIDYLDHKYPDTYKMISSYPINRAKELNVVAFTDNMYPDGVKLFLDMRWVKKISDKEKAQAHKNLSTKMNTLKDILWNNPFYTDRFTIADASVLTLTVMLNRLNVEYNQEIKSWSENLLQDEKIGKMITSKWEKSIEEI